MVYICQMPTVFLWQVASAASPNVLRSGFVFVTTSLQLCVVDGGYIGLERSSRTVQSFNDSRDTVVRHRYDRCTYTIHSRVDWTEDVFCRSSRYQRQLCRRQRERRFGPMNGCHQYHNDVTTASRQLRNTQPAELLFSNWLTVSDCRTFSSTAGFSLLHGTRKLILSKASRKCGILDCP